MLIFIVLLFATQLYIKPRHQFMLHCIKVFHSPKHFSLDRKKAIYCCLYPLCWLYTAVVYNRMLSLCTLFKQHVFDVYWKEDSKLMSVQSIADTLEILSILFIDCSFLYSFSHLNKLCSSIIYKSSGMSCSEKNLL